MNSPHRPRPTHASPRPTRALAAAFSAAALALTLAAAPGAARADDAAEQVTFHNQVERLFQNHCQQCHRPGEAAPMSLLDYDSARPWLKSIKKAITEKTMPPWHADPNHGTFSNDRRLSEDEIATIVKWVDTGAPKGDPAQAPEPLTFIEGWNIDKPDLILVRPEPFKVPATGILDYQHIRLPPFPEDRWVTQIEIRPSNRNVAHHINVFREVPQPDGKKPQKEFVTGFVPGGIPTIYPKGTAQLFPKGTVLILQCHYVTTGQEEEDQTAVGFVFAREPVEKQIYNCLISNYTFAIPPGDPNFEVRAVWKFREDTTVIGTMVHMHLRGKDYMYKAKYPDGREEVLMSVPKYDFNWQMGYHFKDRPKLPRGTVVEGIAHMDNSPGNPWNPDPTATVKYGPQTADEMVMGFMFWTKDNESLADNIGAQNLGPLTAEPNVGQAPDKPETTAGAGN